MVEQFLRSHSSAMFLAHVGEQHLAVAINDKCGWIRRFVRSVPAKAVSAREGVVLIGYKEKFPRPILILEKLVRMRFKLVVWSGIHKEHLDVALLQLRRAPHEVLHLAFANRALISGPTAQHHEN